MIVPPPVSLAWFSDKKCLMSRVFPLLVRAEIARFGMGSHLGCFNRSSSCCRILLAWEYGIQLSFWMGCGSFAFEARAPFVNRIAGVQSVHAARMRGI